MGGAAFIPLPGIKVLDFFRFVINIMKRVQQLIYIILCFLKSLWNFCPLVSLDYFFLES